MLISYQNTLARRLLLPIYNRGSLGIAICIISIALLVAALVSIELGSYIVLFSLLFLSANSNLLGLAPAKILVSPDETTLVEQVLDSADSLIKIAPGVWSPRRYTSDLWASDRICLIRCRDGTAFVLGRYRDLAVLRSRLA